MVWLTSPLLYLVHEVQPYLFICLSQSAPGNPGVQCTRVFVTGMLQRKACGNTGHVASLCHPPRYLSCVSTLSILTPHDLAMTHL